MVANVSHNTTCNLEGNQEMISIIVPVFNAGPTLARALSSLSHQTIRNWECIIIDNNSTDGSLSIAKEFVAADDRFLLFSCNLQGVSFARNLGLEHVRGEFVAFLDSDDWLAPSSLEVRFNALVNASDAIGVCTNYAQLTKSGLIFDIKRSTKRQISRDDILIINEIPMLTALVRTSAIGNLRFVNLGHEDYIFWLHLLENGSFMNLPSVTAFYDASVVGLSANKKKAVLWHYRIMRDILSFGLIQSLRHTFLFLMKQAFRRFT